MMLLVGCDEYLPFVAKAADLLTLFGCLRRREDDNVGFFVSRQSCSIFAFFFITSCLFSSFV